MDLSFSSLFSGLIISAIGGGLFLFGKKSEKMPFILIGLVLSIYPYFISNVLLVWIIAILVLLPLYTFRHSL